MANNRMYLTHRPSGLSVYLGKRMEHGWYDVPDDLAERVRALFESFESFDYQDDFCVSLEDTTGQILPNEAVFAKPQDPPKGTINLVGTDHNFY